jgi:dihydrofolate reductase
MSSVLTDLSISVDGYIAGPDDGPGSPLGTGGEALFRWFSDGDTPARHYPGFRMSAASAQVFDALCDRVGAVITGRRTYDIANGWNGDGPLPGVPLFVLTSHPPADAPQGASRYTFVTTGIRSAVEQAREAAGGMDVSLMGSAAPRQALRAGLLDEIHLAQVPVLLGSGVRLLDGTPIDLEPIAVVPAPGATHLSYRVRR